MDEKLIDIGAEVIAGEKPSRGMERYFLNIEEKLKDANITLGYHKIIDEDSLEFEFDFTSLTDREYVTQVVLQEAVKSFGEVFLQEIVLGPTEYYFNITTGKKAKPELDFIKNVISLNQLFNSVLDAYDSQDNFMELGDMYSDSSINN